MNVQCNVSLSIIVSLTIYTENSEEQSWWSNCFYYLLCHLFLIGTWRQAHWDRPLAHAVLGRAPSLPLDAHHIESRVGYAHSLRLHFFEFVFFRQKGGVGYVTFRPEEKSGQYGNDADADEDYDGRDGSGSHRV